MILGSIGEWIVGNTFPFVVFGTFGASIFPPNPLLRVSREKKIFKYSPANKPFNTTQAPSGLPSPAPSYLGSTPTAPT